MSPGCQQLFQDSYDILSLELLEIGFVRRQAAHSKQDQLAMAQIFPNSGNFQFGLGKALQGPHNLLDDSRRRGIHARFGFFVNITRREERNDQNSHEIGI